MTLKKFKTIDILILTGLAILVDIVSYFVTKTLLKQNLENVYILPSIVVIIFIYLRWGKSGIYSNLALMLLQYILYGNQIFSSSWFAIGFTIGYLSLSLVSLIKTDTKNTILKSGIKTITVYYIVPYVLMILLEAGVSYILGFRGNVSIFLLRHIINFILCLVIMIIAKFQKNFLVDMTTYLRELEKKRMNENHEYDE